MFRNELSHHLRNRIFRVYGFLFVFNVGAWAIAI